MTKGNKIILGIFTFLPFIFICFYFLSVVLMVRDAIISDIRGDEFPVVGDVLSVVITALALGLLSVGLLVYYIIHALNNMEMETNEKLMWVVAFVLINIVAFPVYWYLRIWKRHENLTMATA
ncbi:hypothetical protein [Pollutibacter soli]|uniref:hypothetical protein n=1 Tax=Pollutibacter soli TaxID=3034157 RepID=UPI0030134990